MGLRRPSQRVWIWFSADGTRWKLLLTPDGHWHCPLGPSGKRLGDWMAGFPPGLEALPEGLET